LAQRKEEQEVEKRNKKKEETNAIHELEGKRKRFFPSFHFKRIV